VIALELRVLELIKVKILKITNRATNKPQPFVLRRILKDFVAFIPDWLKKNISLILALKIPQAASDL